MITTISFQLAQRAAVAAKAAATAATGMGFAPNLVAAAADVAARAVLERRASAGRAIAEVRKSLRRMLRAQGGAA
ncbi:hypothetical protein VL21_06690 [Stenotrophomonas maltophilia]|uniref:Uncharacterized protein n=1 Tax=Stenotrophomonas maltophilia TaxID=40324 RepID=A0AA40Y3Z7_STEMA|nr:hypothetical protein [Stenotrophomonas muris]KOO85999.1 hypothetical protein VL21_06690 [Stenotrophomonas maltophilia]MBH1790502.1 hypothetical protein [Stenotrophomonas maltophilia]MCR1817677.1 hypothetical protein [Stenotrophomonas muris]